MKIISYVFLVYGRCFSIHKKDLTTIFLIDQSYVDFQLKTGQIMWLDKDVPSYIKQTLKQQNIPMDKLLR